MRDQGPGLVRTLDTVTAKLTDEALREMNGAVDLHGREPADVARRFLDDNDLI